MAVLQDQFNYYMKTKLTKILAKNLKRPISCLATYSPAIAKILDGNVDIILIGDSLGTTLYGMSNTQRVTIEMMKMHGKAVVKNIKKSLTIIDLPFKTYENKKRAELNVKNLLNYTQADLVKIEINKNKIPIIKHLVKKKFNIITHIGVTPQSYKDFKKIKVVGKNSEEQKKLIELALMSEEVGAKAILLECVTENTAKLISSLVSIPTIGIGASKYCDGQVLVFDDLINLNINFKKLKFVKSYLNFKGLAKKAVKEFNKEVKNRKFPNRKYSYL